MNDYLYCQHGVEKKIDFYTFDGGFAKLGAVPKVHSLWTVISTGGVAINFTLLALRSSWPTRWPIRGNERMETTEQRVLPTSSFWSKKGRKVLKIKGRKALDQLVRMRSAVRICPAAPKSLENFGFQGFFVVFFNFGYGSDGCPTRGKG